MITTAPDSAAFLHDVATFNASVRPTDVGAMTVEGHSVPVFTNSFWTSNQRTADALQRISYRACFKPLLPRFFIDRLSLPGSLVYDCFAGRGTTLIEARLLGRRVAGCDINPLCRMLVEPRLGPPSIEQVEARLSDLDLEWTRGLWRELEVFYHPATLSEITALREYFIQRELSGAMDIVDRWLRMVAMNRLTGHSPGFFSVYTLPPNQAVSIERQRKLNMVQRQAPEYRDVKKLILRKSKSLLAQMLPPTMDRESRPILMTASADNTPELQTGSVDLVVTSPPFLDVVEYTADNWLRGWFAGIDTKKVPILHLRKIEEWQRVMTGVLRELHRVVKPGGFVAFEGGEIRKGTINLEDYALAAGIFAGFEPLAVVINKHRFTKTANCWGVENGAKGTNTNRIAVFRRPD